MAKRIPMLETDRLIIRELNMDDLEAFNRIVNQSVGSEISLDTHQRWLQWTVLG